MALERRPSGVRVSPKRRPSGATADRSRPGQFPTWKSLHFGLVSFRPPSRVCSEKMPSEGPKPCRSLTAGGQFREMLVRCWRRKCQRRVLEQALPLGCGGRSATVAGSAAAIVLSGRAPSGARARPGARTRAAARHRPHGRRARPHVRPTARAPARIPDAVAAPAAAQAATAPSP